MVQRVVSQLGEPFKRIALAVFEPAHFRASYEGGRSWQRVALLVKLLLPAFLLSYLLVILVRVLPIPASLLIWPGSFHELPISPALVSAIGVIFGLFIGWMIGLFGGATLGVVVMLTAGIVFGLPGVYGMLHTTVLFAWLVPVVGLAAGLALGLSFGRAWGVAFSVVVGLAAAVGIAGPDLVADLVIGLGFGLALGRRGDWTTRLEISLVMGLILGVIAGLTAGLPGALASGLMAGIGSLLGLGGLAWSGSREKSAGNGQGKTGENLDREMLETDAEHP